MGDNINTNTSVNNNGPSSATTRGGMPIAWVVVGFVLAGLVIFAVWQAYQNGWLPISPP